MKFAFIAKHCAAWPVVWMCSALCVSRSGFHAWLAQQPSQRARDDEAILAKVRTASWAATARYGTRPDWRVHWSIGQPLRDPPRVLSPRSW